HFADYLDLARTVQDPSIVDDRVRYFLDLENALIAGEDTEFRFHSGVPVAA
ncbi:MAG: hypothetical protein RI942_1465, partial [Pseudomonadota bacterium]